MPDQPNSLLADIADIIPEIGSRSKVYELIGLGEIKAVKIGTRTKIVLSSFHDYVSRLPSAQIAPPRRRRKAQCNGPAHS